MKSFIYHFGRGNEQVKDKAYNTTIRHCHFMKWIYRMCLQIITTCRHTATLTNILNRICTHLINVSLIFAHNVATKR